VLAALVAGLLAGLPAVAAPAGVAGGPAGVASAQAGQGKLAVLDLVFLVDESGSETPQKVADEKATVGTIVQSLLNPDSRVTVIGFGGVNHVAPGQVPTDVACVPTIASGAANLGYLSTCVSKLHRRTEAEGDDTDYAAALAQAMSYLSPSSTATPASPAGAIKDILMMTDGAVDVHRDTQQYGSDWQLGEQTAINQQLSAAKAAGVQFWPLGFGTDIGNVDGTNITEPSALSYLNSMARQAAPSVCGAARAAVQPHATWVNNPDDALNAVDQLYADASCAGENFAQGSLAGGQSTTLSVTIPQIASAAAISVARGTPAVMVTFQPPSGPALSNSPDMSGQDSPVEVLHLSNITQADVGTWKIRLTAPPGLASELVRVTAFWQGAVRALTTVSPPNAKLGQQVKVTLDVLGPNGPISDPATLSSMAVGVTATGNGLPGTVSVPVTPLSGAPGEWTGSYTVPSQPTTLTFTGTAAGYGLYATRVSATVGVGAQAQDLTATPEFTGGTSVQAGGTITGQVVLTNQTGSAQRVKLVAGVSGATAALTSPSGPVTVPSGRPPAVPFTIAVASDSRTGTALVQVEAVNAATGQVLNTATQGFTVTRPPGFLAKYWWAILALVVVVILAILAALWRRRVIRDRKNVRGVESTLWRDGEQKGRPLSAEKRYDEVFEFIIIGDDTANPHLDHKGRATTGVYQVRRGKPGYLRLVAPSAGLKPYDVELHGPRVDVGNGLELSFRDTRHANWGGSGGSASAYAPAGYGSVPGYSGPAGGASAGAYPGTSAASGAGRPAAPAGYAPSPDDWTGTGGGPAAPPPPPPMPGNGRRDMPTMPVAPPPPPPPPTQKDPWL
jgi:von Willebrand factor type A domain